MAVVLSLRGNDRSAAHTVDLNAASGSGLRFVKWFPASALPNEGGYARPVEEVIELKADRDSADNLAATLQDLDKARVLANRYMVDPLTPDPLWLHAKMDGETGERRAVVREIGMEWRTDPLSATGYAAASEARLILRIEREPWWEKTTETVGGSLTESAGAALEYNYTATDVVGDVPARINYLTITSDATGALVERLWMGFRSDDRRGAIGNFEPIWELENGTNNSAAESGIADAADATASGGNKVELVETDLDWSDSGAPYKVLAIELQDISANELGNYGDYLWLLRNKLDANSTTWELQLRWGYTAMDDADFMRGPIVEVSSTSWDYAEMGRMPIPLYDLRAYGDGDDSDQTYAVQLWARETSGRANIDFDCFCLIPLDEGWLKAWDFTLPAGSSATWVLREAPLAGLSAVFGGSRTTEWAAHKFRPPPGNSELIIVYAGESSHDISVGISASIQYFERWANLRGAE